MKIRSAKELFLAGALPLVLLAGTVTSPSHAGQSDQSASSRNIQLAAVSDGSVVKKTLKRRTYLGHAPYICGPSGFGQTSSCFLRASFRK